jgi:putative transposase
MGMMREQGVAIGRFKVSRLMEELGLICKQPGRLCEAAGPGNG